MAAFSTRYRELSRRQIGGLALPLFAAKRALAGQVRREAGPITREGSVAAFSSQTLRPLESVATAFLEAYSMAVTFEEAAIANPDDVVDVTRDPAGGKRVYRTRGGPIAFRYRIAGASSMPENPKAAIQSAIDAHNGAEYPGTYALRESESYFHIVPVARRNASGKNEPTNSPLDLPVTLDAKGRHPQAVLADLLDQLQARSGQRILKGQSPFLRGDHPSVDTDFENVPARAVLRSMLRFSRGLRANNEPRPRAWYLMYDFNVKAYGFTIV